MKLHVYTQKGNKSQKQAEVSEKVFSAPVNESLLSKYVYVYLANQREPIAHTKDRSERRGGGAKPWRQKGTGNARAGSNRSPIWKGGGITFGPTRNVNWKKSMNRKERKAALRSALSVLNASDNLQVVEKIELKNEKLTKQANEFVTAFGNPKKMTIVVPAKDQKILKAFNNIPRVQVIPVGELNAYTAMTAGKVVFLLDALEYTYKWE